MQWANQMRAWSKKRRPETPTLGGRPSTLIWSVPLQRLPACAFLVARSGAFPIPTRRLASLQPHASTPSFWVPSCPRLVLRTGTATSSTRSLSLINTTASLSTYIKCIYYPRRHGHSTRACHSHRHPFVPFLDCALLVLLVLLQALLQGSITLDTGTCTSTGSQPRARLPPAPPPASRLRPRHFSCPHLPKSASPSSTRVSRSAMVKRRAKCKSYDQ